MPNSRLLYALGRRNNAGKVRFENNPLQIVVSTAIINS
jgi:hypothetical protein